MLRKYTEFFENHYKRLLIIPILVLLLSIAYLAYHGVSTGSIVNKGISLKGGTAYLIGVNGIIGNTTMNGANGANGANSTDISKLELLDVDILEKSPRSIATQAKFPSYTMYDNTYLTSS